MSDDPGQPVSVSRTINASADRLFAILARPANHPRIDGSGMLVEGPDTEISGVGDVFPMAMHNDELGDYQIANHVVAFEPGRRIAWEPVLTQASRAEDHSEIGVHNRVRWGYELVPIDEESTVVTEIYDCTESPDWVRRATKNGTRWLDTMTASLKNLDELTAG